MRTGQATRPTRSPTTGDFCRAPRHLPNPVQHRAAVKGVRRTQWGTNGCSGRGTDERHDASRRTP
jgi:hypothetical protein